MDARFCSVCGVSLESGATAYGLTSGVISAAHFGFLMDDNSDWDLFCPACMNTVDRLVSEFKMVKTKG